MRSSKIERCFPPNYCGKLPRKWKKKFKKQLFGFFESSNFHKIYRIEKKSSKILQSISKVKRRGHFLWMYDTIGKEYWKILHIYGK